ncbi:hypothetical protein Rhopal_006987-T1 [Rhodotorula paludigena]|uniref:Glutathione transferase n=1 Tax=Rhodotorula paludigena TaxID=86838 RepID=A0AAV5GUJ6_9BASI|nr:hypothetical protein Rhopal_006987-T1 [Rhodotorula paludigena]
MSLASYNYSLLSIPAVWGLGMASHWTAIVITKTSKEIPLFDNVSPRAFQAKMIALADKSKDAAKVCRAESAQQNVFEHLGLYAAAIVAGNVARLPIPYLNRVAGLYVLSRVAYCILYIRTTSRGPTVLRSLSWLASMGLALTTIVKASTNFNKALW